MKNLFGIVEIGSTNTKAYKYENEQISELGFKTIEFKKNYSINNSILVSDIEQLTEFINAVFDKDISVYVYATSIFRELEQNKIELFKNKLKKNSNVVSVNIVSAKMENELTVAGAIADVPIDENVCVFVGGGGSTEISICNGGKIIEMVNSNIGVTDVMKAFPDLLEEHTATDISVVSDYISKKLNMPSQKAGYIILAGGDFLLRYVNAKYPAIKNNLFQGNNHPLIVSYDDNRKYEETYYHEIPLSNLKATTPDNPNWWNGTRAMCAFTDAVARAVDAKILIPTRITMIYGIVNRLKNNLGI